MALVDYSSRALIVHRSRNIDCAMVYYHTALLSCTVIIEGPALYGPRLSYHDTIYCVSEWLFTTCRLFGFMHEYAIPLHSRRKWLYSPIDI